MNPVGEGIVLGEPEYLYVGTTLLGVYRSLDDSLWEAVNTGIESLNVIDMAGHAGKAKLALTGTIGSRAINLLSGSVWSQVLTDGQIRTLTGNVDPLATMIDIEVDIVTGYIYAMYTRVSAAEITTPLYILRSTDNGNTWTYSVAENTLRRYRDMGNLTCYDNYVAFGMAYNIPVRSRVFISSDYGLTWIETASLGGSFSTFTFINPFAPDFIYTTGNFATNLLRVNYDATFSVIQPGIQIIRADAMAFKSANEQFIFKSNANALFVTTDAWATYANILVNNVGGILYKPDTATLYFGDVLPEPSTLLKTNALLNASGPNPGTAPYLNSIPETSGGIASRKAILLV